MFYLWTYFSFLSRQFFAIINSEEIYPICSKSHIFLFAISLIILSGFFPMNSITTSCLLFAKPQCIFPSCILTRKYPFLSFFQGYFFASVNIIFLRGEIFIGE